MPNLCLLQRHLEVKLHIWASLERVPESIYQVWCQCSKDLLRYDLASFLAALLPTLIGCTGQMVLKKYIFLKTFAITFVRLGLEIISGHFEEDLKKIVGVAFLSH